MRFEELYERYCDGALSDVEREEFLRLLQDPANRARFAELSVFAVAVADELKVRGETPRISSGRMRAVRRPPSRPEPSSPFGWIIGLAAALVLAMGLVYVASRPKPQRETATRPAPQAPAPEPVVVPSDPPRPQPVAVPKVEQREPEPFVVPRPAPPPEPEPPKVAPPAPRPEPTRPAPKPLKPPTVARILLAKIESGADGVRLPDRAPLVEGLDLAPGESVETGAAGHAVLRLGDTRLELSANAMLTATNEKSVHLDRGSLLVDAAKGKPLSVVAPHAEAQVLGTEFSIHAPGAFTRLDVREGRVKFTKGGGVSSVVVGPGQFAIAGSGHELAARTNWPALKLPGGAALWLRGDAGLKVESGQVQSWLDQSGNGMNATAPNAGARPALVAGARPSLRFDGADDHLVLPSGFSDFRAGLTAFVVARLAAGQTGARLLEFGTGNACDYVALSRWTSPTTLSFWSYANDATRGKIHAENALVPGELQSLSAVMVPGGRATVFRGGQPVDAGPTSMPAPVLRKANFIGKSHLGGEATLRGELSEILIYPRALADAERAFVEAYLNLKYFDATSPPPFGAR